VCWKDLFLVGLKLGRGVSTRRGLLNDWRFELPAPDQVNLPFCTHQLVFAADALTQPTTAAAAAR